jgi:hypothetical protein
VLGDEVCQTLRAEGGGGRIGRDLVGVDVEKLVADDERERIVGPLDDTGVGLLVLVDAASVVVVNRKRGFFLTYGSSSDVRVQRHRIVFSSGSLP